MDSEIISKIKSEYPNSVGLDITQIGKIEKFYDLQLPMKYKYFLESMGYYGGGFLKGEDCFYDRIFELREYALELLIEDNSDFILSKEHFVFYFHQGYIFAFFDTSNTSDGSIFYYFEGDISPSIKYKSFEKFLNERFEKSRCR